MSDRRDATEHRDWPWERPQEELIQMEHAELHLLVAIGRALVEVGATQRTISRHLAAIDTKEKKIMATLDNLTAAVADMGADVTKAADDVLKALADLKAQIDALSVGAVTQDQIDALTASVTAADSAVEALDAAVPQATA